MKKLNRTYVSGALALVFAAWIAWQTSMISDKLVSNEPGPRLFPYIAAAGIAVCAILSMIFDGPKESRQTGDPYLDKAGWKRMAVIFLELLAFGLGIAFFGFLLTGCVMMPVLFWTLRDKDKINLPFAILFGVGLTALVYFGFTRGFIIPLPQGALWEMLGITLPF